MTEKIKIAVVGSTSWGTTLAMILARRNLEVNILARSYLEARDMNRKGENIRFVPGIKFPSSMSVTNSVTEAFNNATLAIVAVPSRTFRENIRKISSSLQRSTIVISATKGLEIGTGKRMSEILEEELPECIRPNICVLSGPNLAREIIQGKPSSTVIASNNYDASRRAQEITNSPLFRVYTNDDLVGVELGGALKNVMALGAGICDGLEYGDNSKAAFMTRGLAEMSRLAVVSGANPLTLSGLAGMGDLIATCSSNLSRNHHVGKQLAKGKTLKEIQLTMDNIAEGVDTTAATITLANNLSVDMPITTATYNVLFKNIPVKQVVSELMGRIPTSERVV